MFWAFTLIIGLVISFITLGKYYVWVSVLTLALRFLLIVFVIGAITTIFYIIYRKINKPRLLS